MDQRASGFSDPSCAWRTPACWSPCGHWRAVEPRPQKAGCAQRLEPVGASAFIPVLKANCVCTAHLPLCAVYLLALLENTRRRRAPLSSCSSAGWGLATAEAPGSCVYFSRAQAGQDTGACAPKLSRACGWNQSCSSASSKLGACSISHSSPAPQPSPAPLDSVGGETRGIPDL